MSTTAIQPATTLAASRQFKTLATTFSISGPVIYCLVVYFNCPVFTYWPADGRLAWGFGAATANDGPNMLWYGWTVTTVLIALALGLGATLVPERITAKIPLWLVWLLPILAMPYVIYSLMFWWTLAARG